MRITSTQIQGIRAPQTNSIKKLSRESTGWGLEHFVGAESKEVLKKKMIELCQKVTVSVWSSHWPNLDNMSIKIAQDSSRLSKIIESVTEIKIYETCFIVECWLISVERTVKLQNHHQSTITVIDSGKNHQCMLKQVGENLMRNSLITS